MVALGARRIGLALVDLGGGAGLHPIEVIFFVWWSVSVKLVSLLLTAFACGWWAAFPAQERWLVLQRLGLGLVFGVLHDTLVTAAASLGRGAALLAARRHDAVCAAKKEQQHWRPKQDVESDRYHHGHRKPKASADESATLTIKNIMIESRAPFGHPTNKCPPPWVIELPFLGSPTGPQGPSWWFPSGSF